jgi:hypothetical protein
MQHATQCLFAAANPIQTSHQIAFKSAGQYIRPNVLHSSLATAASHDGHKVQHTASNYKALHAAGELKQLPALSTHMAPRVHIHD